MTQPDLFDRQSIAEKVSGMDEGDTYINLYHEPVVTLTPFTRTGSSIVPPTPDELARARRDSGMQRAAEHAGKEWQDRAVALVRWYAGFHPTFLAEDCRDMAELRGLKCQDGRAWGHVMKRAAKEGIVRADGWAAAKSSNLSAKRLWRSLGHA